MQSRSQSRNAVIDLREAIVRRRIGEGDGATDVVFTVGRVLCQRIAQTCLERRRVVAFVPPAFEAKSRQEISMMGADTRGH